MGEVFPNLMYFVICNLYTSQADTVNTHISRGGSHTPRIHSPRLVQVMIGVFAFCALSGIVSGMDILCSDFKLLVLDVRPEVTRGRDGLPGYDVVTFRVDAR